MQDKLVDLLAEMSSQQKKKMLKRAEKYIPHITEEDLLQPNDFPALENDPLFRYEEGVFHGILSVESALRAFFKE